MNTHAEDNEHTRWRQTRSR